MFSEQQKCEVQELNIWIYHVHLLVMIPLKISVSNYVGTIKRKELIQVLNKFRKLKQNLIGVTIFAV